MSAYALSGDAGRVLALFQSLRGRGYHLRRDPYIEVLRARGDPSVVTPSLVELKFSNNLIHGFFDDMHAAGIPVDAQILNQALRIHLISLQNFEVYFSPFFSSLFIF